MKILMKNGSQTKPDMPLMVLKDKELQIQLEEMKKENTKTLIGNIV